MTKQYISILELFPKLINDHTRQKYSQNLFPLPSLQHHYFGVSNADTPDKKKLTFAQLDGILIDIGLEESERNGNNFWYHEDVAERNTAPYIMGESYEVPLILELEYLKNSVYQDILNEEYSNYIENIMYQYLLYYNRIDHLEDGNHRGDYYMTTDEDSELYQSLVPYIRQMDPESPDFNEEVNNIVTKNYKDLDKIKKPTKKVLKFLTERMYATRNLSELIEIANKQRSPYSSGGINTINRSDQMSKQIPLLMLYSLLAQETGELLYPSYRAYLEDFEDYESTLSWEMRESYSHEEMIEEEVSLGRDRDTIEERHYVYSYGNVPRHSNMYASYHDERMNNFLFPHILNQIRIAGFESSDRMIVPQELMTEFEREPWSDLVDAEAIIYNRHLDWSDTEE